MHLLSINIGAARAVDPTRPYDLTGIYKEPVAGPVQVTRAGLPGDAIISTQHHGGPDQALYVCGGADGGRQTRIGER
jgi:MOSC domain-containing protein YiiM